MMALTDLDDKQNLCLRATVGFAAHFCHDAVSSAPYPPNLNTDALFKARNDISAGEIKTFKEVISVPAELYVLVGAKEAEEVYNATKGDSIEVGPFLVCSLREDQAFHPLSHTLTATKP